MTRSKTPATATAQSFVDARDPAPAAALDLAGVAASLVGLAQAVAAVARFPNTPVPPSLVDRIGLAEDALRAAVEDLPGAVAVGVTAGAYDDDWVKERFDSLDAALKEKFDSLAAEGDLQALRDEIVALKAQMPPPSASADQD